MLHLPPPQTGTSGALRAQCDQRYPPREVVGRHHQGQQLVHFLATTNYDLSPRAYHLAPAEALLNAFPLALAQRVARVPRVRLSIALPPLRFAFRATYGVTFASRLALMNPRVS